MAPTHDRERPDSTRNAIRDVDGGQVVQVGAVHGSVHLHSAGIQAAPHQIPTAPRFFTDRARETLRLQALCHEVRDEGRGRVAVLCGTGGVGKTALAARFLERNTRAFPDGTLYADLQSFSGDGAVDTSEVLDTFLRALGVEPGSIPHDASGRAAAFRSRTHGRRIAVLLDDAVSAAQVRMLIPGQGEHLVLVTTRLHLAGLRLDGAAQLDVRPLNEQEAVRLVTRMLADDRARSEPASARQLVNLCGRLPLALRAAVSGLTTRPHQPLSRMVSRLSGEQDRLARLSHARELSVDSVFTTSYALLPEPARRLYRLLGLSPGRDLTPEAAAALAGVDVSEGDDLLAELIEASLLEEIPGGRLRQHDLVRLHARSRAEMDEALSDREAALDRVLDFYLATAAAADRALNPGRWHLAPVFDQPPQHAFTTRAQALDWLESELDCLRACVRVCHETARHRTCWQMCETMRTLFTLRKHFDVWEETYTTGLASATALDEPAAQGSMLTALAGVQRSTGRVDQADGSYHRALALWERSGHTLGQASTLEGCGMSELTQGRPDLALPYFRRALAMYERTEHPRGVTLMLRRLGEATRDIGDQPAAVTYFERALVHFTAAEEPYMRLRTLVGLAATHLAATDRISARPVLDEALRISEQLGAPAEEAAIRVMFADIARESGRTGKAREELTRALSIYTALDAPQAEETRRRLASLPPSGAG